MNQTHITPVHPGEVLKDELEQIELTQTALAAQLNSAIALEENTI